MADLTPGDLATLLAAVQPAVLVELARARGSTPRDAGARMVVTPAAALGTIGGGQLERMAIEAARRLLARGEAEAALDVPLGPEIGQCCGGRTQLKLARLDAAQLDRLRAGLAAEAAARPEVRVFGAGHVGRAVAAALVLLPVNLRLIDSRAEELARAPTGVPTVLTPVPEAEVRDAPPGAAFVVLTHDHGLDFLIAREALVRGDAAYVGLIGSASKRAAFAAWLRRNEAPDLGGLTCPIGDAGRPDKRPEVIAAFTAAEILTAMVKKVPI